MGLKGADWVVGAVRFPDFFPVSSGEGFAYDSVLRHRVFIVHFLSGQFAKIREFRQFPADTPTKPDRRFRSSEPMGPNQSIFLRRAAARSGSPRLGSPRGSGGSRRARGHRPVSMFRSEFIAQTACAWGAPYQPPRTSRLSWSLATPVPMAAQGETESHVYSVVDVLPFAPDADQTPHHSE